MAETEEVVNTDMAWSGFSTEPELDTGVTVTEGATLTIDQRAEAYWIYVENGTLAIETMEGVSFKDPTLTLKDDSKAGIMVGNGTVEILETSESAVDAGYEGMLDEKLKEKPKAVIRNETLIEDTRIEPPENKWFFVPTGREWSLHNPHLLETYNTLPLVTYWEEVKGTWKQRILTFEEGIWGTEREKEMELQEKTMDGGDKIRLTYDRTEEKAWEIAGVFERRYQGKEKLKELYRLAGPLQRDTPVLFVCENKITYMMIKNVEHEVEGNFYRWNMTIKEEDEAAADRIYTG